MGEISNHLVTSEIFLKLLYALALSFIIGIEREIKRKPIGFKTTAIIATFSCLLTVISIESAYLVPARYDINVTMDPLRLAAQIVSGVGFLGAGAILRRDNDHITGLTTAAMIWGAAGIGIAVGAGFFWESAFAVISVMLVIEVLAPLFGKLGPNRLRQKEAMFVVSINDHHKISDLVHCLEDQGVAISNLRIKKTMVSDKIQHKLYLHINTHMKKTPEEIYLQLIELPYVYTAEVNFLK